MRDGPETTKAIRPPQKQSKSPNFPTLPRPHSEYNVTITPGIVTLFRKELLKQNNITVINTNVLFSPTFLQLFENILIACDKRNSPPLFASVAIAILTEIVANLNTTNGSIKKFIECFVPIDTKKKKNDKKKKESKEEEATEEYKAEQKEQPKKKKKESKKEQEEKQKKEQEIADNRIKIFKEIKLSLLQNLSTKLDSAEKHQPTSSPEVVNQSLRSSRDSTGSRDSRDSRDTKDSKDSNIQLESGRFFYDTLHKLLITGDQKSNETAVALTQGRLVEIFIAIYNMHLEYRSKGQVPLFDTKTAKILISSMQGYFITAFRAATPEMLLLIPTPITDTVRYLFIASLLRHINSGIKSELKSYELILKIKDNKGGIHSLIAKMAFPIIVMAETLKSLSDKNTKGLLETFVSLLKENALNPTEFPNQTKVLINDKTCTQATTDLLYDLRLVLEWIKDFKILFNEQSLKKLYQDVAQYYKYLFEKNLPPFDNDSLEEIAKHCEKDLGKDYKEILNNLTAAKRHAKFTDTQNFISNSIDSVQSILSGSSKVNGEEILATLRTTYRTKIAEVKLNKQIAKLRENIIKHLEAILSDTKSEANYIADQLTLFKQLLNNLFIKLHERVAIVSKESLSDNSLQLLLEIFKDVKIFNANLTKADKKIIQEAFCPDQLKNKEISRTKMLGALEQLENKGIAKILKEAVETLDKVPQFEKQELKNILEGLKPRNLKLLDYNKHAFISALCDRLTNSDKSINFFLGEADKNTIKRVLGPTKKNSPDSKETILKELDQLKNEELAKILKEILGTLAEIPKLEKKELENIFESLKTRNFELLAHNKHAFICSLYNYLTSPKTISGEDFLIAIKAVIIFLTDNSQKDLSNNLSEIFNQPFQTNFYKTLLNLNLSKNFKLNGAQKFAAKILKSSLVWKKIRDAIKKKLENPEETTASLQGLSGTIGTLQTMSDTVLLDNIKLVLEVISNEIKKIRIPIFKDVLLGNVTEQLQKVFDANTDKAVEDLKNVFFNPHEVYKVITMHLSNLIADQSNKERKKQAKQFQKTLSNILDLFETLINSNNFLNSFDKVFDGNFKMFIQAILEKESFKGNFLYQPLVLFGRFKLNPPLSEEHIDFMLKGHLYKALRLVMLKPTTDAAHSLKEPAKAISTATEQDPEIPSKTEEKKTILSREQEEEEAIQLLKKNARGYGTTKLGEFLKDDTIIPMTYPKLITDELIPGLLKLTTGTPLEINDPFLQVLDYCATENTKKAFADLQSQLGEVLNIPTMPDFWKTISKIILSDAWKELDAAYDQPEFVKLSLSLASNADTPKTLNVLIHNFSQDADAAKYLPMLETFFTQYNQKGNDDLAQHLYDAISKNEIEKATIMLSSMQKYQLSTIISCYEYVPSENKVQKKDTSKDAIKDLATYALDLGRLEILEQIINCCSYKSNIELFPLLRLKNNSILRQYDKLPKKDEKLQYEKLQRFFDDTLKEMGIPTAAATSPGKEERKKNSFHFFSSNSENPIIIIDDLIDNPDQKEKLASLLSAKNMKNSLEILKNILQRKKEEAIHSLPQVLKLFLAIAKYEPNIYYTELLTLVEEKKVSIQESDHLTDKEKNLLLPSIENCIDSLFKDKATFSEDLIKFLFNDKNGKQSEAVLAKYIKDELSDTELDAFKRLLEITPRIFVTKIRPLWRTHVTRLKENAAKKVQEESQVKVDIQIKFPSFLFNPYEYLSTNKDFFSEEYIKAVFMDKLILKESIAYLTKLITEYEKNRELITKILGDIACVNPDTYATDFLNLLPKSPQMDLIHKDILMHVMELLVENLVDLTDKANVHITSKRIIFLFNETNQTNTIAYLSNVIQKFNPTDDDFKNGDYKKIINLFNQIRNFAQEAYVANFYPLWMEKNKSLRTQRVPSIVQIEFDTLFDVTAIRSVPQTQPKGP